MSFDFWTLGFQAVNVLVLIWLLQRFFWKPVAAAISDRQAKAAAVLDEAEAMRTKAVAALAEIDTTRKGFETEREAILADARKDAGAARDTLLGKARAEADALQETAKVARVRAAAALKKTVQDDAKVLALTIAAQLAARLDGAAADAAFLGWLVEGINALPESDRTSLAESAMLELVSAVQLDAKPQDHISKAISSALGASVTLTFRTDPALIAGYELHSPHVTLRNSWAADLARIAAALADDMAAKDAVSPTDGALTDAA